MTDYYKSIEEVPLSNFSMDAIEELSERSDIHLLFRKTLYQIFADTEYTIDGSKKSYEKIREDFGIVGASMGVSDRGLDFYYLYYFDNEENRTKFILYAS